MGIIADEQEKYQQFRLNTNDVAAKNIYATGEVACGGAISAINTHFRTTE